MAGAKWQGPWGAFGGGGGHGQKGVTSYALASNRQKPFAGAAHAAVFNVWRRARGQILYVIPPFIGAYFLMEWAEGRNHYLNSKAGRAEYADSE